MIQIKKEIPDKLKKYFNKHDMNGLHDSIKPFIDNFKDDEYKDLALLIRQGNIIGEG